MFSYGYFISPVPAISGGEAPDGRPASPHGKKAQKNANTLYNLLNK
jgi:hypothetical protein